MKLIDKYILKKFLSAFVFTVLILVAVIVVIDITEKLDKFSRSEATSWEVVQYYLDFVPWIANLITPITTFIATVFVTAQLAGRTEIIAILSSGVSFRRMLMPYFIGASCIAILTFVLSGWVIPNSNKRATAFEMEHLGKAENPSLSNIHLQTTPDTYLYIRTYNNESDMGFDFTLEQVEGTEVMGKLTANRMSWDEELQKWKLTNWKYRSLDSMREELSEGREMDTLLNIHPGDFENIYRAYDAMTLNELNEHIDKLVMRGASGVQIYLVEKYTRYSAPFAVLILTFMGVIVSSRKTRGGAGLKIAIGFVLSFLFLVFFLLGKTYAEAGSMDPAFSVWIPNIIFAGISLVMYRYLPR
ncbi:LptF/LptG family permease [Fulvivirga sedimenti]|uniref:LptF/LptG family permease n=1 Tax=Fulvivirga sedimenti TaxID=2879465 RepID=A0A9X1HUW4_9BACT|nr:LptF/LptG family permease [Fulvivirga sedimenti]MCA6075405.1 LptF/LptG family permease [Fulvivirga sedimenti]MCA6076582.1 LptF/LptG family permease [Fulvivirga sedimenti]MCA6077710.1 LptF/LptG family permease [Fulvivirga sedimenti]